MTRPHEDPACRCVACKEHDLVAAANDACDSLPWPTLDAGALFDIVFDIVPEGRLALLEALVAEGLLTADEAKQLIGWPSP